jgi:hypothetical protein
MIKRGILGAFSGSVGNIVGSSWKGIGVMKAKPLSVANPKTAGQVAQRSKFSAVVALARILLVAVIKPMWDRFAQLQSGYNAFVSANIDTFTQTGELIPGGLSISEGSLALDPLTSVTPNNGDAEVEFEYLGTGGTGNALDADQVFVVGYNETQDNWASNTTEFFRSDDAGILVMPTPAANADIIHLYLAFRRADGTIVSNTSYATAVV